MDKIQIIKFNYIENRQYVQSEEITRAEFNLIKRLDQLQVIKLILSKFIELEQFVDFKIFLQEDIICKINGRIKSPYSIWNKIKNKNISFEQLSYIKRQYI